MPRMKAVSTVTWTEWDDKLRTMTHKTLHPADPARGRDAEVADVPQEVIDRIEALREREVKDHLAGRVIDHRAGHVRLVPEDEYDEYTSAAEAQRDPLNQFSDDDIRSWDADTTVAHLNQTPGLADRVLELEKDRKPTRRAVVAHAERVKKAAAGDDVSEADRAGTSQPLLPAEEA